jgi:hypothetical protein
MDPCLSFCPSPTASTELSAILYVYYRVEQSKIAAARRAVMALFEDIRAMAGLSGRLAHRIDDPTTWMEIYQPIADIDRFQLLLESRARIHEMHLLLAADSRRNIEKFREDALEPSKPDESRCA